MPDEPITIDTTIETIPRLRPSYDGLCVVGIKDTGSVDEGELQRITNNDDADTYFGTDTTMAEEIKAGLAQGARYVYGYFLETTTENETVSIDANGLGDLTNIPSCLETEITASGIDIYTTYEDIDDLAIDATVDIGSDEVIINTYTKEVLAEATGSGYDITFSYTYVDDWSDVRDDLEPYTDIGVFALAGLHNVDSSESVNVADFTDAGGDSVTGVYNTLISMQYGDKESFAGIMNSVAGVFVMPIYGRDTDEALTFAHEHTADVVQSKNVFAVAHILDPSTYYINGTFGGAVSLVDSSDKLMWKRVRVVDEDWEIGKMFNSADITYLEGKNVNALFDKTNQYLFSSGLSTSTDSSYKWIDVTRTQYMIEHIITSDLESIIRDTVIPFNSAGLNKIRNTILSACRRCVDLNLIDEYYTDEDGDYLSGFLVTMPEMSDMTVQDKEDRKIENVEVVVKIPGHIHEVYINMTLLV